MDQYGMLDLKDLITLKSIKKILIVSEIFFLTGL